jgi:hypothetical protein
MNHFGFLGCQTYIFQQYLGLKYVHKLCIVMFKNKNIKTANLPNPRAQDSLQFRIFLVTSEKNNVQKKKKKD